LKILQVAGLNPLALILEASFWVAARLASFHLPRNRAREKKKKRKEEKKKSA